jgi:hypothetical protein
MESMPSTNKAMPDLLGKEMCDLPEPYPPTHVPLIEAIWVAQLRK